MNGLGLLTFSSSFVVAMVGGCGGALTVGVFVETVVAVDAVAALAVGSVLEVEAVGCITGARLGALLMGSVWEVDGFTGVGAVIVTLSYESGIVGRYRRERQAGGK